ncbi:MAG: Rad52/Rad22 family DNA repair protein [Alphaproteobacteria bacterium]|nr:Rad52/Rad22 family DNA repair protein [Alphaproteobacteria bacterium]
MRSWLERTTSIFADRTGGDITLSYLEGWHVIAEANRIFGFDGWDRETISSECVWKTQAKAIMK